MVDKNGREIKTGDFVRIEGAYFKNDNTHYIVVHSPGDFGWFGSYYSLIKVSPKSGELSTAKYRTGSWPIAVFINDRFKKAAAKEHNREHATIEIVNGIPALDGIAYFKATAAIAQECQTFYEERFGKMSREAEAQGKLVKLYNEVAQRMSEK